MEHLASPKLIFYFHIKKYKSISYNQFECHSFAQINYVIIVESYTQHQKFILKCGA